MSRAAATVNLFFGLLLIVLTFVTREPPFAFTWAFWQKELLDLVSFMLGMYLVWLAKKEYRAAADRDRLMGRNR